MYKNGIIKWAENGFSEQIKECFDKYDNGILSGEIMDGEFLWVEEINNKMTVSSSSDHSKMH